MDRIFEISNRLINSVSTETHRYLYTEIAWNDRLIMIKGARGVGKTTMMQQRCHEIGSGALYASLDLLWFNDHTISQLADYHYKHGGTHLFLDEVHRYSNPHWEQEIKNIVDSYPGYHITFTGSSLLQIDNRVADLSRRVAIYHLSGLSFREYLHFTGKGLYEPVSITRLLSDHTSIASQITSSIRIFPEFEEYIRHGYYPFFMESSISTYFQRVERIVSTVIDIDIPAVENIEYETQTKLKKLLVILAEQVPFVPNATKLSKDIAVSRSQLMKLIDLLCNARILRSLYDSSVQPKGVTKPEKILFDNPSIMQALGVENKIGTIRETFIASMLSHAGKVYSAREGDFLLDRRYTFEVGGSKKGFSQIADKPDSFVIADNIETGYGNKIPAWLFGFLY